MNVPLSHFHTWEHFSRKELQDVLFSFAAHGLRFLSLDGGTGVRLSEDPGYGNFLQRECRKSGVSILNCHAPHMPEWEINLPDPMVLKRHLRLLDFYAELGCETVTVHAGTNDSGEPLATLRDRTCRSLEALIRRAGELRMVIVLENTIFPTDTPEELLGYMARFRCESFGFCFDAGHANLMDGFPGKRSADMVDWIARRWDGNIRFETDTLGQLLPDVVTCHLHDNDGFDDQHKLPGEGSIDWPRLLDRLEQAPRLRSFQNESEHLKYRVSVLRIAACFRELLAKSAVAV